MFILFHHANFVHIITNYPFHCFFLLIFQYINLKTNLIRWKTNLTLKINFLVLDDLLMAHFRARMITQAELEAAARVFFVYLFARTGLGKDVAKEEYS